MKKRHRPDRCTKLKGHMRDIVGFLRDLGASDIVVTQPKHYRCVFLLGDRTLSIVVASTPRCEGAVLNRVRQDLRRLGVAA